MVCQPRENLRHLRWSLPFTENHFRHARAQPAMMVNFGEAEIFKRQMAKAIDGVVGREFALAHLHE